MTEADLLQLIYDAPLDPVRWSNVLSTLGERFGWAAGVLYDRSGTSVEQPVMLNVAYGYSEAAHRDFQSYFRARDFRARDVRVGRVLLRVHAGHVYVDDRDIAFSELEKSEIQTDFYRRNGVGHVAGVILSKRPERFSVLSLHRDHRFGAYTAAEVALLDQLAPHVVRAWGMGVRLSEEALGAAAAWEGFESLGAAMLLVEPDGTICRLSRPAEMLLARACGLRIWQRRLEATGPGVDARLKAAARRLRRVAGAGAAAWGCAVAIAGGGGVVAVADLSRRAWGTAPDFGIARWRRCRAAERRTPPFGGGGDRAQCQSRDHPALSRR